MRMTEKQIQATAHEIAVTISSVQCETGDPPGWEFDMAVHSLATYFMDEAIVSKRIRKFSRREFIDACNVNSSRGKPEVPEVPEAEAAHNCGGPTFGRLTPGCPRCDELQAGAAPRQGWSRRSRYDGGGYGRHSCQDSNCGPCCTAGDW